MKCSLSQLSKPACFYNFAYNATLSFLLGCLFCPSFHAKKQKKTTSSFLFIILEWVKEKQTKLDTVIYKTRLGALSKWTWK